MSKINNILLSLIIAMALGISGCGGGGGSSDSSAPTPAPTPTPDPDPAPEPDPEPEPMGTQIDINLDMKHVVGGVETFDRRKFIGIHASPLENEWLWENQYGPNESDDLITDFLDGYDVYLGRNTGGISWELRNVAQDPAKPGFVSEASTTSRSAWVKNQFVTNTTEKYVKGRQHEQRATDMIIGAQQHPFYPDGTLINSLDGNQWAFSQADSQAEPFGTATGHYMGQYLSKYFGVSSTDANAGQPKPKFIEVMNEPLYDLVTVKSELTEQQKLDKTHQIFEFHNAVANEIRKTNPGALIGGYTVAFPNFEEDNFNRWEQRDKAFIDIAGDNMDFLSLHLYDFPAFQGKQRYRRGGNLEATFDMLEQYTDMQFGAPTPMIVSEYGAQVHSHIKKPWSPYTDWENVASFNAMMMSFMERPDLIWKTLPFIVVKGEWGRTGPNQPYQSRLMRRQDEPNSDTGNWVYTNMIHFFELWKDVKGTRVDSWSSEVDIQVDAYVEGTNAYVILNNLEFSDQELTFNALGLNGNTIDSVKIKHFFQQGEGGVIEQSTVSTLAETITLKASATMVLELTFANDLSLSEVNHETKYYAESYKQAIAANQAISFNINDVELGSEGEAVLRMGVGRDFNLSLLPTITLNGKAISVPEDYRGDDQYLNGDGRESFFGLIEIPVSLADLQANNTVEVTFADGGGYVLSMTLQVFDTTRALTRTK
ncbi:agarase [Neiella sp. HB171785]|uniref:Agarase n=1 Tax=Neiella litorisoli TaxID=2771431 RepID=A0A8J6QGZ1_9GAMM|nr:agarase [Neiella litorisoli]MBD1388272.1 agarase [Neiella litorisoli]